MSRVFIINDLSHNFDRASKYGTLVYVTEGRIPIFKTDLIVGMLREGLKGFTTSDYLLVSGPAILCMVATIEVLRLYKSQHHVIGPMYIQTLVFDAKEQDYIVRHLPV